MSAIPMAGPATYRDSREPVRASVMERVFERVYPALYRFVAVRVGGDAHLAEDLLQQLWLAARENGPALLSTQEAERWLRSVARKLIATHWRRQANRPRHVPIADPGLASAVAERLESAPLPSDWLDRDEVRAQLQLAITELKAEEQALIVGHYFEQRTQGELAREHGVSARAIEGRLYRARQALRATLRTLED